MKRLSIFLLCLALLVCATACFKSSKKDGDGDDASKPATAAEQTVATTAATTTKAPTPKIGTVNDDDVCVRPQPNTEENAVGGLYKGDTVKIIGEEGDFFKIEFHDQTGLYTEDFAYVSKQYVTLPGGETSATTGAPISDPTKPAA